MLLLKCSWDVFLVLDLVSLTGVLKHEPEGSSSAALGGCEGHRELIINANYQAQLKRQNRNL